MKRLLLLFVLLINSVLYAQNYQYLSAYDSNGVPTVLAPSDVISPATMALVNGALPEGYPVPVYNPQYIYAGYDTDLILDSAAQVWVTFVTEGAGYRNVLGFYTYDVNNPPTTAPTSQQITIIFPNVSLPGSGGNLPSGSKVSLGTFPAGTGIGWVLLADGWNGSSVTNGFWKLYSNAAFNPEVTPSLKYHNVLISDPDNQRVILGFEDIKRNLPSCDHDFNDAVFYVTANPYSAMRTANCADVEDSADVTSGNDGGLESNGDLATLIAKRNFTRVKTNSYLNKKSLQAPLAQASANLKTNNLNNLDNLFPDTGMYGTETAYVSSPEDLLTITNATDVFSVDYYAGNDRVAAGLATYTSGSVYNHSKAICDRLNGASLEDVRTVILQDHEMIMVKLKRDNIIEYALIFSVSQSDNVLHSYWNVDQFPAGDYINIQVWGKNMGQVCSVVNHVLNQLGENTALTSDVIENRVPSVFVKKGSYKNGKLNLDVVNKSASGVMQFNANIKETEFSEAQNTITQVSLNGEYNQHVEIETGGLFDVGFSVTATNSVRADNLYMADGPWGVDYLPADVTLNTFEIEGYSMESIDETEYVIERDALVTGQVKGTMNLFRNILPGELLLDVSAYNGVTFDLVNSKPIEVVMVTEGLTNWDNRLRFQVPAHTTLTNIGIPFENFTNPAGDSFANQKVKGFVFSVGGNYTTFEPFTLNVHNLKLGSQVALGNESVQSATATEMFNYPNPFKTSTSVKLPVQTEKAAVYLVDITGRIVVSKTIATTGNSDTLELEANGVPAGVYIIKVVTQENQEYQTKCVINN
jgi:Domain of unknown function (DUF4114)/Secretion system C-terminal sorting domain